MTTDYEALKAYGHSPSKAAEIVLDASRGDDFCRRYIAMVQHSALAAAARRAKTPKAVEGEAPQSGGAKQRNAHNPSPTPYGRGPQHD